jgi:hypothetical protein
MYNELGSYCPLTTSSDYVKCESGYKYRCYYDYNDFDENDFIAPTISQVLKWLREEKLILIGLSPMQEYDGNEMIEWCSTIYKADKQGGMSWMEELYYESYEQAALAGIEYVLDNLISK